RRCGVVRERAALPRYRSDFSRQVWSGRFVVALIFGGLLHGITAPLAAASGKAQAKYDVDRWGVDQGLLHDNVASVLQTRDGYLWIGSDGGLARFDGVKFLTYRTHVTPGLVGDTIRCLFEDSAGVLWIGSDHG